MFSIEVQKTATGIALTPRGDIDGSAAWRVVRLARRFTRASRVVVDLGDVERLLPFGVSVLAQELPRGVAFRRPRREHLALLVREGLDQVVTEGDDRAGETRAENEGGSLASP